MTILQIRRHENLGDRKSCSLSAVLFGGNLPTEDSVALGLGKQQLTRQSQALYGKEKVRPTHSNPRKESRAFWKNSCHQTHVLLLKKSTRDIGVRGSSLRGQAADRGIRVKVIKAQIVHCRFSRVHEPLHDGGLLEKKTRMNPTKVKIMAGPFVVTLRTPW